MKKLKLTKEDLLDIVETYVRGEFFKYFITTPFADEDLHIDYIYDNYARDNDSAEVIEKLLDRIYDNVAGDLGELTRLAESKLQEIVNKAVKVG